MTKKLYVEMDDLFSSFIVMLNEYDNSEILQNYFFEILESLFYATLIDNFFSNLTPDNLEECGLSIDVGQNVKNKYENVRKDIDLIIHIDLDQELEKIDAEYYYNFKSKLENDFPKVLGLIAQLEKEIDINQGKIYLRDKKEKIKEYGRTDKDLNSTIMTIVVAANIKTKNRLPSDKDMDKLKDGVADKLIPGIAQDYFKSLKSVGKEILTEHKEYREEFELFLYKDWKEPLDLFECLIRLSLDSVDKHRKKIIQKGFKEDIKFNALIVIHARALRIANEVLTLLKAGYPDGANARWRSLHELAVISIFLSDSDNIVSQKYLEHESIMRYKEAVNYQEHCGKLGYPPHEVEFLVKLEERKDYLCKSYGKNYFGDWGWIPKDKVNNQSFTGLEKHIGLDRLHPFYKLSSAHIHGSSRGLYSLGLMNDFQNKILSVGASNYGLADPLQNAAISLMHVTNCLLTFEPDFESITIMRINQYFIEEIGTKAVEVQKVIEKSGELDNL
jgi:hypothetical protein